MNFHFPIVIIDEDFSHESAHSNEIRELAKSLQNQGQEVSVVTNYADLNSFARQHSRASAFLIAIDDADFLDNLDKGSHNPIHRLEGFILQVRRTNADIPIFLFGETKTSEHLPNSILRELHGFIHRFEDTPDFVAKHILRESKSYLDALAPPFFRALLNYAQNGSYSWHCPGHSGGVAFLKSPVGQLFHQFFGENMLRADVCNAVEELGQLLDHTGPIAASERNAARIFNADHLFFVTNGTSTSNKIVWHANVAPDDIVIVDRNCHKSILHAIMMTGATPIYLSPTRNHYGIIGPIPEGEFTYESIQQKIQANPFIKDKNKKPRILTITQSTYDGVLYNVDRIKTLLDGKIEVLHFDEAWLPHANFHDFYKSMHAIGKDRAKSKASMIFSTQSTHKMLAGLSQASQILVAEPETKSLNKHLFNEAFMMHTSTSPQYSIIASCDVTAAMMESPGGTAMIEESLVEAIEFRSAMQKVDNDWGKDWWFKLWGPKVNENSYKLNRDEWVLGQKANWHGFDELTENFNMLDPLKATVITPGLEADGSFSDLGIPASLVTKYLSEHGVIVEKCGLYSFFIMFTLGITKGRWNTLVATLQQFKDDFDRNQPVGKVLPQFSALHPQYERIGLKDLCQKIHAANRLGDVARMTTEMYLSELVPAMRPSEAFHKLAHGETQRVPIDKLEGQITAVLLTPYPPGIPLLVPGEKFNKTIVNYLKYTRDFNLQFPGFETDVHGLVTETTANHQKQYFVDCIKN